MLAGTETAARVFAPFLEEHEVFLMASHGALTLGKNLEEAFQRMEILEHYAQVLLTAGWP